MMCWGPSNLEGTVRLRQGLLLLVQEDGFLPEQSSLVHLVDAWWTQFFSASALGFQHHEREIQNHADGHHNHDIMVSSFG